MDKEIDINKDVVSYQEALDMCSLGFDDKTLCAYETETLQLYLCHLDEEGLYMPEKDIAAPLYSQAFRWFREKYELYHSIIPKKSYPDDYVSGGEFYAVICGSNGQDDPYFSDDIYTYPEAELACLIQLIKISKTVKPQ